MKTENERTRARLARKTLWGGALLLLFGFFAVVLAGVASLAAVATFGVVLVAAGLVEVAGAFRDRNAAPMGLVAVGGLLSVVLGLLFVARPLVAMATVTLLLAAFLFANGVLGVAGALAGRPPHRGWVLFHAIVVLALGAWLLASWPAASLWVVGTVVGAQMMARGLALLGLSFALRRMERKWMPV